MRPTPNKYIQIIAFFALATLAFSSTSTAEKIFTWKDENGRTHYTNNEALVPLKNDAEVIKMKTAAAPIPEEPPLNGQALWEGNCIQCHHIEVESFKGMQGMPKLIGNIKALDSSAERSLEILQGAIKGNMDDNIKSLSRLNPDELKAIITYISDQVALTTPPVPEPLKK